MFIKEYFIARESVIKLISKRLTDLKEGYRQNIALIGDELIGKTWIIRHIFDSALPSDILTLYFDLSSTSSIVFANRFLNTILFTFLKTKGISLSKESLPRLIEEASEYIPLTASKIAEINSSLKKEKVDIAAFREMVTVFEVLSQETGKKVVVVFDEFQNLDAFKIRNVFEELGKKIMTQKNILYVLSSSYRARAKKIIQEELSLLFGNFEIIEVEPFDVKTSTTLVKNRLKNKFIPQDILRYLINFTGGHPFYLDKITQHIYQNAMLLEADTITPFIFIYSLEEILFNEWGMLHLRFQNYLNILRSRQKTDVIAMLVLIAQGKNRLKDLSSTLHKTHADINQKLSRLHDANVINRCGSFYSINDRVFSFWLNFVYGEKTTNLSQNYEDQVIAFRKKIEQSLLDFIELSKQDIAERLRDLFGLFANDPIQLERNKTMLSKFNEIKPIRFNGNHIQGGFFCSSDEGHWLIGFKHGDITEDSVAEFIDQSKEFQTKDASLKRLFVGMEKTELNARLLAKEAKIITWDKNSINVILDLFGRPRIII